MEEHLNEALWLRERLIIGDRLTIVATEAILFPS